MEYVLGVSRRRGGLYSSEEGHAVPSALTRVLKESKDHEAQMPRSLDRPWPMIAGAAVRHQDHRMNGLRLSIPEARPILLWISGMSVVRFRLHLWDATTCRRFCILPTLGFASARLSTIFPEHPFNVTLAREHDRKLFAASLVLPCPAETTRAGRRLHKLVVQLEPLGLTPF